MKIKLTLIIGVSAMLVWGNAAYKFLTVNDAEVPKLVQVKPSTTRSDQKLERELLLNYSSPFEPVTRNPSLKSATKMARLKEKNKTDPDTEIALIYNCKKKTRTRVSKKEKKLIIHTTSSK